MCPVLATFIGLITTAVVVVIGYPLAASAVERFRGWMKSLPRTNSFGPGAVIRRCSCHKINFGGGPS